MVLFSVDLEDQTPVDHEVDSAHSIDEDLAFEEDAEQVQPKSNQGFKSAVGIGASDVDQPPGIRGKRSSDPEARSRRHQPKIPGRFERREERLVALTSMKVDQCGLDSSETQTRLVSEEVTDALAAGVLMHPPSPPDPDMGCGFAGEDPDAVHAQRIAAGQGATVKRRPTQLRVKRG